MPHTDLPESTPDLDDALHELRERMANSGVMVGIIADLRRNSDRLKPMLADELRKLRTLLDEILPLLSVVALGLLLAGCAVDLGVLFMCYPPYQRGCVLSVVRVGAARR